MSVSLCVSLSVCLQSCQKLHLKTSRNILYILLVAKTLSSSDDDAKRYEFSFADDAMFS